MIPLAPWQDARKCALYLDGHGGGDQRLVVIARQLEDPVVARLHGLSITQPRDGIRPPWPMSPVRQARADARCAAPLHPEIVDWKLGTAGDLGRSPARPDPAYRRTECDCSDAASGRLFPQSILTEIAGVSELSIGRLNTNSHSVV